MKTLSRNRWIAVIIALIFCITAANLGGISYSYGLSEKSSEKKDLSQLKPTGELGLLITGSKVNGTKGFQKDILYLTQEQMEQLKSDKNPGNYGLGKDSWKENQRYSSYDNHGAGTFHYTIADGLDVNSILNTVVKGGIDAVETYWIWSADSYSTKKVLEHSKTLKYYKPGDTTGTLSAAPLIAFYKTTTEATDQSSGEEPEYGSVQRLAAGENVFIYGQTDPREDNNCHFIKKTQALYVEDPDILIRTDNDQYTSKWLKDFLKLGIYQTSYSFTDESKQVTHNLEGVPLTNVLQNMNLSQYLADYSDNRLEVVSADGTKKQITRDKTDQCFLSWGFSDDRVTDSQQTGQLALYMPGTTKENSIAYNVSKINVVDSAGQIVTSVPSAPKPPAPAAPQSLKAAKNSYNSIKLTWGRVSGANGYDLYRYNKNTGSYQKVKTLSAAAASYTDTGLDTNTTYTYKVKAYTTDGKANYESAFSNTASAKPILNKGVISKLSKSKKNAVKIKWKKVPGANGYQLYRATKKSGAYKRIATVKNGKTVSYTNKKLKKKKTYYYKIRPYRTVNHKKQYGSFSKVKKIRR